MDATDLREAAAVCAAVLGETRGQDWSGPAGDLRMSVAETVAHVGDTLLWYAADAAAGPSELSTMDLRVRPETPPAGLLATVQAHAAVLAAVVTVTPASERGWHPAGLADASGFAAMGCDEILVHTADAAAGLGVPFAPDPALAARVVHRLFPWAPGHPDPWAVLLWCNGRAPLGERPRREGWRWHCAPLDEWDGSDPAA
ncbi:maleylpyruvate isomerase N-terminal domain-containing protein [Pseudonocardia sp. CA-142604]|uniref:maleylpyruvate isomerase N-terminal domain-containing protein n=1 Tax=Pseudonocardia sp. CA-142604 TaxID=3240024 RepID=UPI003D89C15F